MKFFKILSDILPLIKNKKQRLCYAAIRLKNKIKEFFFKRSDNKFLFILSPPFCGSTLLNQLISTSSSVSVNNPYGNREGQNLPEIKKIFYPDTRWKEEIDLDWKYIKKTWMKYWDLTKPILLEKSPPNIIRAEAIKKAFSPHYFIIFYRNPYAHCESLMRRNNYSAAFSAELVIRYLTYQKYNIEKLDNVLNLSYEELTENIDNSIKKIANFLPELKDIKRDNKFTAHNYKAKSLNIENLNIEKINKLTASQIQEINIIFIQDNDLLNFFGYKLIN